MVTWSCKHFDHLSARELYRIIALREQTFVVEQKCLYLDCDGYDLKSYHLMGSRDGELVAYLRIIPPKIKMEEVSFGRVAVSTMYRKLGLGRELTKQGLVEINKSFPGEKIKISAQKYLEKFYGSFGFKRHGDPYLDVGIPHIDMYLG
ncbi:MAG: GNAT family N-acetyltransferase [Bacteriovoracaceae bacterium]|nr:GNAT family N-acetyltransferase [Bacteriovoracaceae bacterium]